MPNVGLMTGIICCPGGDFCDLANALSMPISTAIQARFVDLDYLFDIASDERERANHAAREPELLMAMREAWERWNATMPPIPDDATVSLGYSVKDMPQR